MDELDLMIERVKTKRSPKVPLFVTCAEVFYEFADEMSDETFLALEETYEKVRQVEGAPVFPPGYESIERLIRANPGHAAAYNGFTALVAERLMAKDRSA
jgi:hypothetical protein